MRLGVIIAVVAAVALHAAFILFGGLLIPKARPETKQLQDVELLSDDAKAKKPDEQPPETKEEVKNDQEKPPDAEEVIRNLDQPPAVNDAPALDAASLSAIEAALNGEGGSGGDFATSMDFSSGGRIGGTGKAGGMAESLENAFSLSEIDQQPRATTQVQPAYPSEMRGKKIEAVVVIIFIVDANGRVSDPKVERSSNAAYDKSALEAVKKWKFEPAVKGGQRVACKMRVPIRFPPNG